MKKSYGVQRKESRSWGVRKLKSVENEITERTIARGRCAMWSQPANVLYFIVTVRRPPAYLGKSDQKVP